LPSQARLARVLGGWNLGSAVAVVATIIASTAFGGNSIAASLPLAVLTIVGYASGLELAPLGFLSSILVSVLFDMGGVVGVYMLGLIAHMILEYAYMRAPRELYRYKLASVLGAVVVVSTFYPVAVYSRVFSALSPGYDPFLLGTIVVLALVLLIYTAVMGGIGVVSISDAMARAFDASSGALAPLSRILAVILCVIGSILYRDPILLAVLAAGIPLEGLVSRLARPWQGGGVSAGLASIVRVITPLAALAYVIIAGL